MVRRVNRTPLPLQDDSIPHGQVSELREGHPLGLHPDRHLAAVGNHYLRSDLPELPRSVMDDRPSHVNRRHAKVATLHG